MREGSSLLAGDGAACSGDREFGDDMKMNERFVFFTSMNKEILGSIILNSTVVKSSLGSYLSSLSSRPSANSWNAYDKRHVNIRMFTKTLKDCSLQPLLTHL